MKKEIVLQRDEEPDIISYPTLWDAYRGFKEIRRMDKEEKTGIPASEYYWTFRVTNEDGTGWEQEIKFYVRKNKMYYKLVGLKTTYEKVDNGCLRIHERSC